MRSFQDATVLVTGASSGIGEAFVRNLAGRGANLILVARSADKLEQLAQTLSQQHNVRIDCFPLDLAVADSPETLFEQVNSANLSVDVLINNAGIGYWGNFTKGELRNFQQMIDLNVRAVVSLSYLFLPPMIQRQNGGIINVSSVVGFQPIPYASVYVGTKAFVLHYSESLWGECRKHGVTITALCPSTTNTNFFQVAILDERAREMRMQKTSKTRSPDFVAEVGLSAFLRGKNHVIPGLVSYLSAHISQLSLVFARRLAVTFAGSLFDPDK